MIATLACLGVADCVAEEEDKPIVLDIRQGTRKADGSYELPSPLSVNEDGSLQFSNGKRMSMKEAMERHISSGNARGPDGQRIDPNNVIVNDDGSISRRDGTLISKPSTGSAADVSMSQRTDGDEDGQADTGVSGGEQDEAQKQPGARPASAVGGIELISGGASKDGIATVGEIPVLR